MPNTILRFYNEVDPTRALNQETLRIKDILHLFEPGNSARFLDIGCYDGSKTMALATHMHAQEVCGVDFLSERLEQARERGIEIKVADLNAQEPLPYLDGYFDCIFVGDVIEHLFSPDFLLMEICRLLRQGGYAVLTTPNLASWRNRIALLLGWQPFGTEVSTRYRVGNPRAPRGMPSGHIRVFTASALGDLVQYYGLRTERLAGLTLGGQRTGLERLTTLVDSGLLRLRSTLCDELVIKVRRQ